MWVANTRHGPGGHWFARVSEDTGDHDHLRDPADAVDYLERHRVPLPAEPPSQAHLDRLADIRSMIRDLVDQRGEAWPPPVRAILDEARFATDPTGGIRAAAEGWDAFVWELMLPLLQLVELRAGLRLCGNPLCRLVYLDLSKNHSRRWCDNGGCGNRDRVGRYRSKQGPAGERSAARAARLVSAALLTDLERPTGEPNETYRDNPQAGR